MNRQRVYRTWTKLTEEEVIKITKDPNPEEYADGGFSKMPYTPPLSEKLVGKEITLYIQEQKFCYSFLSVKELIWSEDGTEKKHEYYQAREVDDGVLYLQHLCSNSLPATCVCMVIDLNTNLVTRYIAVIGNGNNPREVRRTFTFGRIDSPNGIHDLHHFTEDLKGKAIKWTYLDHVVEVKHIYFSPLYYCYSMPMKDGLWEACNPADYIKINDHIYLFSFLEERQAGVQGSFLINLNTMHDVGGFFGINSLDKFECYTFGAKGQWDTIETQL